MKKFSLLILTVAALSSKCAHAMEDSIKDAFLKRAAVYKKNIELRASSSSSSSSSSSAATTTLPQAPQDLVDVRYSSASASSSSSSSSCNTKQSASSASTSTNSCTPTPFYASLGIDEFRKANIAYEQARSDRKQQLEDNDNPYALEKNFTQEELLTLAKIEAHNNPTSPQATAIDQKQSAERMQIDPNEVQTIANAII